jgi:hypothetical protein
MPDTVLAKVADGRLVTLSGFRTAWKLVPPPERPDSLTPETARRFLDLLINKEALAEAALRETWVWSPRDSAEYTTLRDGLTMKVVLDSALAAEKARLGPAGAHLTAEELGESARDEAAQRRHIAIDTTTAGILAGAFHAIPPPSADSSIMAQLRMMNRGPDLPAADLARTVASTPEGPFLAQDMVASWTRLNPAFRPRIDTRSQVEQALKNQLFERELRREVDRRRIEQWPDIQAQLARKREYIAVTHLVAREVYDRISMDSTTLRRHFEAHRKDWDIPLRVALARLVLDSPAEARRMAAVLSDGVRAESLISKGAHAGVRYAVEVTAESDSTLFARGVAAGAGKVLGPDSTRGGWQVARVLAIEPGRPRTFAEAQKLVAHEWYGLEGERLMVELMARSRKQTSVEVSDRALARLTSP